MQLLVNDQQEITSYVIFGGLVGGIDYVGPVPDTFTDDFKSKRYCLQDDVIVLNSAYVAPTPTEPKQAPSPEQQSLTAVAQQMAEQRQYIASVEQALTALAQGGTKS